MAEKFFLPFDKLEDKTTNVTDDDDDDVMMACNIFDSKEGRNKMMKNIITTVTAIDKK